MTWINYGCGPHNAPGPWVNVDCVRSPSIVPDMVVAKTTAGVGQIVKKYGTAERVYLGHVLEHMPWDTAISLLDVIRRGLLQRGGEVCVVGPDVHRVLEGIGAGWELPELLESTWESDVPHQDDDHPDSDAARHHWNCHEDRLVRLLRLAGFGVVEPITVEHAQRGWPLVSGVAWQCAVRAMP